MATPDSNSQSGFINHPLHKNNFDKKKHTRRDSEIYLSYDQAGEIIGWEEKPFRLSEVIKFDSLRKMLKDHVLHAVYIEAVERWDSGYYKDT